MPLKLGKLPARPGAVKFRFANYVDRSTLPVPPKQFGHEGLISDYGMLGNADYGDCVWAGAAHETMLWCAEADTHTIFNDEAVLSDYSAVTGFNPADPSTDNGTDMEAAAAYRRRVGIVDANGNRHQIGAYLAIEPGNIEDLRLACYIFGAVGIGIEFPASAMDQFNRGKGWSIVRGSPIEGGHYTPIVAKRTHFELVTWGKVISATNGFLAKYMDEAICYVSAEMLTDGKSLEGFDVDTLNRDLQALGH
jgi:hypothetical protein